MTEADIRQKRRPCLWHGLNIEVFDDFVLSHLGC